MRLRRDEFTMEEILRNGNLHKEVDFISIQHAFKYLHTVFIQIFRSKARVLGVELGSITWEYMSESLARNMSNI